MLKANAIRISMDGSGRWLDNVLVERLWRSVKQDEIYRYAYADAAELHARLSWYFDVYNRVRPHQSLGQVAPQRVYTGEVVYPQLRD